MAGIKPNPDMHEILIMLFSSLDQTSPLLILLCASSRISAFLGATGTNVLTRLSGLIILVVTVQFILKGAKAFFAGH